MKYLIAVGICLVLVVSAVDHYTYASMYWNFETPDLETLDEPQTAPSDIRPAQQPARKPQPKMYDDYELPEIEPMSAEEPPSTATPVRSSEDSVSGPVVRPQTPRRTQQAAPPDTSIQTVSPRPALTQPGAQSTASPSAAQPPSQAGPEGPSAPVSVGQEQSQQPTTKKMKWGKTESGSN